MAWQGRATTPRLTNADRRMQPSYFVSLVGRLIVAQAGASAAIGLGYRRRNMPWLIVAIVVAMALCALAGLVRSGSHASWLAAMSVESGLVAVALFLFAYARYLGGSLLAIIGPGALLHPAVARAFAAAPGRRQPVSEQPAFAAGPADVLRHEALTLRRRLAAAR